MVLKMKPRRGDIMVEYYWRYKLKPRRGGIIKSQDDFIDRIERILQNR